jgi:putative inorganic carbon (HCO3(-)) transporter
LTVAQRRDALGWFELAVLMVVTPLLLYPGGWRALALITLPAIWIVNRLAHGHFIRRTPYDLAIFAMLAMVLVSLYATYDISRSAPDVASLLLGISLCYAVIHVSRSARSWWLIATIIFLAGLGLGALGLFGMQRAQKFGPLAVVLQSIPAPLIGLPGVDDGLNSNSVAGSLLWVVPSIGLLAGWLIVRWQEAHRLLGPGRRTLLLGLTLVASIFLLGVVVLTQSRTGYLALAAGSVVMVGIGLPSRYRRWGLIGGLIIVVAGAIALASTPDVNQAEMLGGGTTEGADPTSSLAARAEIWSRAIYGIQDFPITGMGMGRFQDVMPVLYPLFSVGPAVKIPHAHNEFLQTAVDLGLVGAIALVALHMIAFWMLRDLWRCDSALTSNTLERTIYLGLFGALTMHVLYGLIDAIALGSRYSPFFWLMLGLIAGRWLLKLPSRQRFQEQSAD